jgi:hypothetical protein
MQSMLMLYTLTFYLCESLKSQRFCHRSLHPPFFCVINKKRSTSEPPFTSSRGQGKTHTELLGHPPPNIEALSLSHSISYSHPPLPPMEGMAQDSINCP